MNVSAKSLQPYLMRLQLNCDQNREIGFCVFKSKD